MNEFFQKIIAKANSVKQPMLEINFPGILFCEGEDIEITQAQYADVNALVKLIRKRCGKEHMPVYFKRFYFLHGKKRYEDKANYFLGGTVRTAEQVNTANLPEESTLRSNIRLNNYKAVIKTPYGNTMPFDPDVDQIIKI